MSSGSGPARSLLEVTEDPLEALYGYFSLKLTPSPATLAELALATTFDMRVSREGRMPTHLLGVYQADGDVDSAEGRTMQRAILMLPIDRVLFERGFKLNLDQPDGGADDEEDNEEDEENEEESEDDDDQTRSLALSSSSSSSTSSSSHIYHIGGTHPSALPRPHIVYTSTPNPSHPSPTPAQSTPTLMVTLPVIPMQVPHVRSLPLLLLYGMGLERNTNLLAWSLLPVSVVEEFPNAAEMAMILARMRESVFDGVYRHNQGMWKNVLKFGFGAGGRNLNRNKRRREVPVYGAGGASASAAANARDRKRREKEDARVLGVVQTAWNISAEARKLRRAGAHLGNGVGGGGAHGSGSGRHY